MTSNLRAMGKLKREVEKAKRTLSSQQSTRIEIESFEDGNDFSETLTRAKFEELNMDLFRKTMKPVEQVLKDANVKKEDVSEVSASNHSNRNVFIYSRRLSLLVVPPVSRKCSNFSRSSLEEKNRLKESILMKPSLMVLLYRLLFYLVILLKRLKIYFYWTLLLCPLVSRLLVVL